MVVERNDLDLLALDAALGVNLVGKKLERLEADLADAGAAARQRIDETDFQCFLGQCAAVEQRERK